MKTDHFEQLYRGNYARLYYYAFRFVADEEACRDIVNDVFEQAWKDREQLQEATAVACLYTRTRNRCIDYLRHRQVEQQYATFLRTLTSEDPSIPPGEREERVRRMERYLERMTDPTRSIVKQCYYDGKKYREVAEERGITPDGVKKHIVKALRMLREELGCGEKRMKRNWNTENDRPMDMKENEDRMGRTLDALEHPGRFTKEELEEKGVFCQRVFSCYQELMEQVKEPERICYIKAKEVETKLPSFSCYRMEEKKFHLPSQPSDAIAVTCPQALEILDKRGVDKHIPVFCFGHKSKDKAKELGFSSIHVCPSSKEAIVQEIVSYFEG